jgi:hypothetical protein
LSWPSLKALDQKRPLAHVPPLERERLLRAQPRVAQHDEQRGVTEAAVGEQPYTHDLDQRRRNRLDRRPVRFRWLARELDRVARHAAPLDFSFVGAPTLAPVGAGGFAATVDQLGMLASASVGIRVGAIWQGVYDVYGDFAPEVLDPSFRFPVTFATVAPSPPATTPTTATTQAGCAVPRVKRMRASKARRRMRAAGCRYRVVRVRSRIRSGRVVSTRPTAGRLTTKRVVIRVSRGRRAHASSAQVTGHGPYLHA